MALGIDAYDIWVMCVVAVLGFQTEVAGAEVAFEKDRSHGALTGPAHYKRARRVWSQLSREFVQAGFLPWRLIV